jgi:hypothetical protein
MKVCTKCNIEQIVSNFTKNSRNKNGLHHCCEKCLKEYRENNKERILEYGKIWRSENAEYIREYSKNIDRKEYHRNWKKINRETINKYYRDRKKSDPFFKFKLSVRNLIYNSFRRQFTTKSKRTTEILGCSFEEFKSHIESQFNENMSWDNYGSYWEFDHIIQLSTAKNEEDVILLNNYLNFQPLEVYLNREKNFKY